MARNYYYPDGTRTRGPGKPPTEEMICKECGHAWEIASVWEPSLGWIIRDCDYACPLCGGEGTPDV